MSVYRKGQPEAWDGEIGPVLAEARERRGLSLKEAERSTKIRARYLEGLERENPGELPDKSYVQGFLSSYAEFLGLDAEELNRRFKRHSDGRRQRRQHREPAEERSTAPASAPQPGRRSLKGGALLTFSLAALALVLVVAAFYLLGRDFYLSTGFVPGGDTPSEEAPDGAAPGDSPPGGQVGPEDASGERDPTEAEGSGGGPMPTLEESSGMGESEREESLRVTLLVRGSESWISVESDSGVEYTGIAQPGFSRSFESDRSIRVTTGNAGAVRMEVNGQEYGTLGESGEVVSRSFTLKSAG